MFLEISVVFFEVTVLIAASVREVGIDVELKIEHKYYSESKGLINYIKKGKIIGITTVTIEEQANKKLEKAILDELKDKIGKIDKEKFKNYTTLFDSIQRKFIDNIRLMDRLHVDENTTQQIMEKEVNPMYSELSKEETLPPEPVWALSFKFKQLARDITRMQKKQHMKKMDKLKEKSIIPDPTDKLILSEAIYLKRGRFKNYDMYLVSLDKHFSGFANPYEEIPKRIEEKFKIECLTPRMLLPLIS